MRQTLAIARREWRAYCASTQAPVITTGFLVLCGLFYYLLVGGYADQSLATLRSGRPVFLNLHVGIFHRLYGYVVLFLLFLLPAVTMRLVSAEYRSGRYDLITSWPVSERQWILGKWLSAVAVAKVLLLGTLFYFLLIWGLGRLADPPVTPQWQPLLTALIGLSLLAGTVAAWGLAASALLSHQAGAYFLGFATVLCFFLVGQLAPSLPTPLNIIAAQLALGEHFLRFAGGVIDSRDVVYYLGLTAVGLAIAEAALAGRRLATGRRATVWLRVLAVLAVAVFLQAVAVRRPLRVDLTPDRLYSLAPQTERILTVLDRARQAPDGTGTLPPPVVEVLAFYQYRDGSQQGMQALLQSFADRTPRFRYQLIDPDLEPDLVREHGITATRTVIVTCEGRRWHLLEPDESQLASAVYRLATDTRPVVYWMLGHGEVRLDLEESGGASALAEILDDTGYAVRPLVLPQRLHVLDDAAVVVWAGPKLDPSDAVLELLDRYLAAGGAMACFFGPDTPPALRRWTERYNVRQLNDVVVSPSRESALAGVGLRTVTVVEDYGGHPAVSRLTGMATTFHLVQTLGPVQPTWPGVTGEVLLLTGPDTWGETDLATRYSGQPSKDPAADHLGPRPFAVALDIAPPAAAADSLASDDPAAAAAESPPAPAGRLILIGNASVVTNANINLYGNRDLVLNLMGWLVEEEDLLGIRGRRRSFQPLLLSATTRHGLGWLSVLVWPGLVGTVWTIAVLTRSRRR
ncbi:MAG: Gldg family protein [Candidatus Krumholzibacteria bacterium]|nr:Gldg family protein [Candidatus Krumholzibacteria bacterium]